MNTPLLMSSASNTMSMKPSVVTGTAYTDCSAWFASANKEYLTIPSNSSLQTGDIDFEIGGWVRFDTISDQDIVSKRVEYGLVNYSATGIRFWVNKSGIYGTVDATNFGVLSANTWYFIRGWHDAVNNTLNVSVNGITNTVSYSDGVAANTLNFIPGKASYLSSSSFLNGRLDSWYFTKRISTTAEATALYNAGAGRTFNDLTAANGLDTFKAGLISWWNMDSESGTQFDSKGTNHLSASADPIIAPPVYGSELIVNGGFETAGGGGTDVFGSWTEAAGFGAVADEGTLVHTGSHAVKLTGGSTINTTYVSQSVTVTAGSSYYLSFWSRGDGTNPGKYGVYDITNSAYIIDRLTTNNPTTSYQLFTTQFTAPVGCTSVRIYLFAPDANGGIAYFDDVSVKQIITPSINNGGFEDWTTPTNAAVWSESVAGASTVNQETTTPYAGSSALRFDVDSSGNTANVVEVILVAGKKYTYSIYAKGSTSSAQVGLGGLSTDYNAHSLTTSYTLYSGTFIPVGNSFMIRKVGSNGLSIYIDQVTLTSLGPTAEAGIAAGNAIDGNFGAGFNGSSQYLSVASNASLQTGDIDYSVWGWININRLDQDQTLIAKDGGSTPNRDYTLKYNTSNKKLSFSVWDTSTGLTVSTATADSLGILSINNWYFVVAWHDSVNNTLNIRVNNGATDSVSYTDGIRNSSTAITIGSNAAGTARISGQIDNVGLLKRILTSDEATALYNNGKGLKYAQLPDSIKNDSALKGYWNLDERSGTRYDSTPNANHLTDNGGVTQVQGVNYYGGAVSKLTNLVSSSNANQITLAKRPTFDSLTLKGSLLFDGVDDSLVISGDKIGTGDVTVFAVINARGWGGASLGRIIDNYNGHDVFRLDTYPNGSVSCSSNGSSVVYSATSSISLNTSYIVTVTRTSAGIVNFYINGKLSGTANQDSGTPATGSNTYIGNRAAGDRAFDGWIGSIHVLQRILNPGEIQAISKQLSYKHGGIY